MKKLSRDIAAPAQQTDFREIDECNIYKLLDSHWQELSTQDLLEQQAQRQNSHTSQTGIDSPPFSQLSVKDTDEIVLCFEMAIETVCAKDISVECSSTVRANIRDAIRCYHILACWEEKPCSSTNSRSYFSGIH